MNLIAENTILAVYSHEIAKIVVFLHVDNKIFMLRKVAISLLTVLTVIGFTACNSDSDDDTLNIAVSTSTSVAVSSFTISPNSKVLHNLDSVYFSIDLNNALIFNADSLPVGTDVRKLVVNISTSGSSSIAELHFKNLNNVDTIVNYLENPTDSINFANGPVRLHLVAPDASSTRDYQIKVNVHKMNPDSLYWNRAQRTTLPMCQNRVPSAQKTVFFKGNYYTMLRFGSTVEVYKSPSLGNTTWTNVSEMNNNVIDINEFTTTDACLYILTNFGHYLFSYDGVSWSEYNHITNWTHIIGSYGKYALAIEQKNGKYYFTSDPVIPGADYGEVPADFPVSGNSVPYTITTDWTTTPQIIITGGRNAEGRPLAETWAFDGQQWANISVQRMEPLSEMTMFPYFVCSTDTVTWKADEKSVLVALGGIGENSKLNRTVYVSGDLGFHWKKAGDLMQLPDYIPAMAGSQAFIENETIKARSKSAWTSFAPRRLPFWYEIMSTPPTRAVAPITQWDTPYIYLVGGYGQSGELYNTIWRGTINRLSFKPLQ